MFRRALLLFLPSPLLSGCAPEVTFTPFIEPYDGQTGVELDEPLKVHHAALGVPESSFPKHLIRVLDLDLGEWVEGDTHTHDGHLVFTPDMPWEADHDFHWHVPRLAALPRGPELELRAPISGDAVFSTGLTPAILSLVIEPESVCLVLSSSDLLTTPVVYVDDARLETRWTVVAEGDVLDLSGSPAASPGILCAPSDGVTLPVRAEWGDDLYSAPSDGGLDLQSTLELLRRYAP